MIIDVQKGIDAAYHAGEGARNNPHTPKQTSLDGLQFGGAARDRSFTFGTTPHRQRPRTALSSKSHVRAASHMQSEPCSGAMTPTSTNLHFSRTDCTLGLKQRSHEAVPCGYRGDSCKWLLFTQEVQGNLPLVWFATMLE